MTDSADSKGIEGFSLIEYLATSIPESDDAQVKMATKAVRSLAAFLGWNTSRLQTDLELTVIDWLVWLRVRDLSVKTAFSYLKAVSGLYTKAVKAGLMPPTEVFRNVKARLRADDGILWEDGINREDFDRFSNFAKAAVSKDKDVPVAADIVILSLLTGCKPITEVAKLKAADMTDNSEPVVSLLRRRMADSSRQYIFPLRQSRRTPRQLRDDVCGLVARLFSGRNIRIRGSLDETVSAYWAYAAILSGVKPHDVASFLGVPPPGFRILELYKDYPRRAVPPTDIIRAAARMFTVNPLRWYAMHLRKRVTFEDIKRRFAQLEGKLQPPEMYYPCEELSRRVGKKIVFGEKPIIRDIVFFRSRVTDLFPLFSHIGDIAWCFTTGGKGTVYAAIPQKSFEEFQATVGRFTSRCSRALAEDSLKKGDEVVIVGGSCKDVRGEVLKIEKEGPEGIISYLIRVFNDLTDNFRVSVDARQLRRLPDRQ